MISCGYVYTPLLWPSLFTVLLLIALAAYAWRRRDVPGALPFAVACLFYVPWAAALSLEVAAVNAADKIFWVKFQAPWLLFGTTAVTCFLLDYAWPGRWLTRRNLALLFIPPLLALGLVLTNDLHHLFWRGFVVEGSVTELLGPAAQITFVYAFVLLLVNFTAYAWLFLRSPQHRWPVAIMVTGQIVGRTLFLLDVGAAQSDLPLSVLGTAFLFVMFGIALFGFRLFDPIPLARQAVIAQMRDGALVLDPQRRVAGLNPAAERILGVPAGRAKGQPITSLLPTCPDGPLADPSGAEIELSLGLGQAVRHYTLAISPLTDWRGVGVGRLLLLHDVTGQKQAQAQILEQQRTLATLQERERLARELHDSTGQVLGYVSLQAQAISKRLREGDTATAETQLARLAGVAQNAHADLRDSILSLRSGDPESWSFLAALQQHLAAYQDNYGIRAELILPPGLGEDDFAPGVGLQLLRVIQEALTNARKHGRACRVQVAFGVEGDVVRVTIEDDGMGFDPGQPAATGEGHYGLEFMAERVEALGGRLLIDSSPGAGTRVELELPGKLTKTPGGQSLEAHAKMPRAQRQV